MESSSTVFISAEELHKHIESGDKNLRLFDATTFMSAEEGDPILAFKSKHLPG
jgi:hypothetical protein